MLVFAFGYIIIIIIMEIIMLIKILTNQKTTVIIEKVEDVEILGDVFGNDLTKLCDFAKHYLPRTDRFDYDDECAAPIIPSYIEYHDDIILQSIVPPSPHITPQLRHQILDYKKNGEWKRLILQNAYICNDEGKTIHKINS